MKREFTKLMAALALLVAFALPATGWGQEQVVTYTLTPANGTNNSYTQNCDIEIGGITWNLTGNSQMNPWRIGGKSLTNVDRTLYSKTAISDNITKIEVTHGEASSITINSWTVIVATDADFTSVVSTLTADFQANKTTTINRPDGADWSNCYYKFVYNVSVSGGTNKFLEFTEAKFYKENSGGGTTTYTVTYDANGGTGTMTDPDSPYEAGEQVTLLANTFTAPSGYEWSGWEVKDANDNTVSVSNNQFTMPASNVTVTAQWTQSGGGGMSNATYTIASASSVTPSGTVPTGSGATFTNTYTNNKEQLTSDNSMTLTLSGYQGKTIKRIVLKMHSNTNKGAGWMNAKAGSTSLATIGSDGNGVAFSDSQWNSSYTTTYTDVEIGMSNTSYPIGTNEDVVIYIKATENSLYCQSFTIYYEEASSTTPSITITPDQSNFPATITAASDLVRWLQLSYNNFEVVNYQSFAFQFYDDENNETTMPDWIINASVAGDVDEGFNVFCIPNTNEGPARTAYFKVYAVVDGENVYSNLVTVSQDGYEIPAAGEAQYVKVTSTDDLTDGQYLIVYEEGYVAFDGGLETLDAVGNTIEVILNNNEIEVTNATAAAEFTIATIEGGKSIKSASGYYIGQTSDANGLASSTTTAYTNTISIVNDGDANIVSGGAYLRYNKTSGQTRFRYFKSSTYTGQEAIQLYKKVFQGEDYEKEIVSYTGNKDHYYLIASPVGTVVPSEENGFLTNSYDLYRFDQLNQGEEWRNYQSTPFYLLPGKGYLYANSGDGENNAKLTFSGVPYNETELEVALAYVSGATWAGWNLIGNPFATAAYLSDGRDFFRMNEECSAIVPATAGSAIAPMEGIFVVAESSSDNSVTFTTTNPNSEQGSLALNLSRVHRGNASVVDRAIVRFGEGRNLAKFVLNDETTKVSFKQDNKDYAVVYANSEGEMPVSFKAEKNGTYTISFETEGVEMTYLHLIDNMTGTDVGWPPRATPLRPAPATTRAASAWCSTPPASKRTTPKPTRPSPTSTAANGSSTIVATPPSRSST